MVNIQKLDSALHESETSNDGAPDLTNPESRLDYLRGKLDDIMNNIGTIYGERLTQELLRRLEVTIQEFHQEVLAMLDRLEKLEEERRKTYTANNVEDTPPESSQEMDSISDWEKRLELLEQERATKTKSEPEPQDPPALGKRYFIGKKGLKR